MFEFFRWANNEKKDFSRFFLLFFCLIKIFWIFWEFSLIFLIKLGDFIWKMFSVTRKKFRAVPGKFNFLKLFASFCFPSNQIIPSKWQIQLSPKWKWKTRKTLFLNFVHHFFPVWVFLEVKKIRKSFKLFFSDLFLLREMRGPFENCLQFFLKIQRKQLASNSLPFPGHPSISPIHSK